MKNTLLAPIQNIPLHSKLGRMLRWGFKQSSSILETIDYAEAELRLCALGEMSKKERR